MTFDSQSRSPPLNKPRTQGRLKAMTPSLFGGVELRMAIQFQLHHLLLTASRAARHTPSPQHSNLNLNTPFTTLWWKLQTSSHFGFFHSFCSSSYSEKTTLCSGWRQNTLPAFPAFKTHKSRFIYVWIAQFNETLAAHSPNSAGIHKKVQLWLDLWDARWENYSQSLLNQTQPWQTGCRSRPLADTTVSYKRSRWACSAEGDEVEAAESTHSSSCLSFLVSFHHFLRCY